MIDGVLGLGTKSLSLHADMQMPDSKPQKAAANGLNTGTWSPAEDDRLREAVAKYGTRWVVVAAEVSTRNGDQCAKRWTENLNPDLDHSPWTPQEDRLLMQLVETYGRNWKFMANSFLESRAPLALKNRYSLLMRRLKRQGSAGSKQLPSSTVTSASSTMTFPAQYQNYFDLSVGSTDISPPIEEDGSGTSSPYRSSRSGTEGDLTRPTSRVGSFTDLTSIFGTTIAGTTYGQGMANHNVLTTTATSSSMVPAAAGDTTQATKDVWHTFLGTDAVSSDAAGNISMELDSGSESAEILIRQALETELLQGQAESCVTQDNAVEYSVTCSRGKLKNLAHYLCDAAMSETGPGSSEEDQVTLTLRLKN
ncbi:hypothetical protein AJ80_08857 [Polytolypa hystricis UAMH7299]|uniref:Myb-like domain-containing protein n=1 Tax=Polytolypa hystricis (strain UAMH7299) TaxID=1447883 RepID=A0A2B7X0U8_POLH7|nr:hypothetical protein AJ80_08857 [Polytolypa hystricis UAMH7299]